MTLPFSDTARLDYLERHPEHDIKRLGARWRIYDLNAGDERARIIGEGATLREAIDAAILAPANPYRNYLRSFSKFIK